MNQQKIEHAVRELLVAVGEDPDRSGLVETPKRVAKMYQEIFSSLNHRPEDFANYKKFHVDSNPEMVSINHIPIYSMCEHHLLPFFGYADIAYIPNNNTVLGLSKIPRLVEFVSKKPTMQEKITTDIVKQLAKFINPKGIAVAIKARHLCMEMRGINKYGQYTYTSDYAGLFNEDDKLKQEFLKQRG
ncbi:MAG: GTP cyclohydrolase I FolE [Lactobacillus iners]|jgi:GTP cyclohydrolase IA|uniref:GTP cyclohydrolase I FolE n=1 Tax=Lactobacillus iners TaxID=147802 RepID=UPI00254AFCDC|nr:GTP cyclohydrolase I FolE [Lactobacillus iners]MCT7826980.1 GTP cyclohydrolase I FolE [Lactobacillus iners]MDK8757621.1 GTP cyclohydrolase I FolE [Lactobacillus iners]MDX5070478.1 GTP cyclohydrolase I FolE [Lactobacillus iners]MDX5084424.1 GTP cyclohydrolase I FolE [Lactobacillus iners]MDX5095842.1 GTP cyclohydrolase I FolE [Lactobacillus iners]